jgi:hypothetical protein
LTKSLLFRALAAAILPPCWLVVLSYLPGINDTAWWVRVCGYLALFTLLPGWILMAVAGRLEATSRPWLLFAAPHAFRMGIVMFGAGLLPWIATVAGLLGCAEAAFTGRSTYATIAALIVCTLVAVLLPLALKRTAGSGDRIPSINGVVLSSDEHEQLWSMVRSISRQSHARAPQQLVAVLSPSFDVYFSPVRVSGQVVGGLTLTVSLPLCRLLRTDEFRAILTHCFATIRDSRADGYRVMADLFRRSETVLDRIQHVCRSRAAGLLLAPALLPLKLCLQHILERIGRKPGLASEDLVRIADEEAVRNEGVSATANALFKTNAFPIHWFILQEKMKHDLQVGVIETDEGELLADEVYSNLSALFARFCTEHPVTLDFLEQHASGSPKNLRRRLFHLGWSSLDHWSSMTLEPRDPATLLIHGFETIERDLTETERAIHGV